MFYDKNATKLKSMEVVANPVHVVLMNFSPSRRHWSLGDGLTLLGFIPLTMERCEDNRDSETVRPKSLTYWLTITNEVDLD